MKISPLPWNPRKFTESLPVHCVAAVGLALIGTAVGAAQASSSDGHPATAVSGVHPPAAAAPSRHSEGERTEAKPNDAGHQGIKIHGHWKIVVKNPDGSLSSTRDFENSLGDGGVLFSYLLAGQASVGEAAIQLSYVEGLNVDDCRAITNCRLITESPSGYWANSSFCTGASPAAGCYAVLTLATPVQTIYETLGTEYQASLVLAGSFVATSDGPIDFVATRFATCSSASGRGSASPTQCYANQVPDGTNVGPLPVGYDNTLLTATFVAGQSIQISAGQTVQVTVTLSFS